MYLGSGPVLFVISCFKAVLFWAQLSSEDSEVDMSKKLIAVTVGVTQAHPLCTLPVLFMFSCPQAIAAPLQPA